MQYYVMSNLLVSHAYTVTDRGQVLLNEVNSLRISKASGLPLSIHVIQAAVKIT